MLQVVFQKNEYACTLFEKSYIKILETIASMQSTAMLYRAQLSIPLKSPDSQYLQLEHTQQAKSK